jgi:hypothetical protein
MFAEADDTYLPLMALHNNIEARQYTRHASK